MNFKYFADHEQFTASVEELTVCEICNQPKICFASALYGEEDLNRICPDCLFEKKLYGRKIFTNQGDWNSLISQLKVLHKELTEEQLKAIALDRTKELEQATPHLITWQDMEWPCLNGDYAQFIGYGSKPMLNSLAPDGNGKLLFQQSLHPELQEYYNEEQWEEYLPTDVVADYKASSKYGMLFYVFKSIVTDQLIIWWDCA